MFQRYLAIFLITGFFSNAALAESTITETQPIAGDPFRDFRIEGCSGTRAFGLMRYSQYGPDEIALTDICLDEDLESLQSVQPAKNLTLVGKDNGGYALEVLESGNDKYSRVRIEFLDGADGGCLLSDIGSHVVLYNVPRQYLAHHQQSIGANLEGYSIGATAPAPATSTAKNVVFYLRPSDIDGKGANTYASLNVAALGTFSFNDGSGHISLDTGDGYSVREPKGQLSVTVMPNGELQLIGDFAFQNRRLAGHHPEEWVTLEGQLIYMRGHFLGPKGNYMKGFGFARGTYVDASGKSHSFSAGAGLYKCFSDTN